MTGTNEVFSVATVMICSPVGLIHGVLFFADENYRQRQLAIILLTI